jgi:hypothetical protein
LRMSYTLRGAKRMCQAKIHGHIEGQPPKLDQYVGLEKFDSTVEMAIFIDGASIVVIPG